MSEDIFFPFYFFSDIPPTMNTEADIERDKTFDSDDEESKQNEMGTCRPIRAQTGSPPTPEFKTYLVLNIPDEDDEELDDSITENTVTKNTDRTGLATIMRKPPSPEHVDIVLVNIKKAAEERYIYCEKKSLDDGPAYVALSYRWGELDEQMVAATDDYHARIVSFKLDDFFTLCQAMQHEPDLQHIDYVWVDAFCVDQEHVDKRRATIYRMTDIYLGARVILAVPDLHASHLSASTTANRDVMQLITKYRRYLYCLLDGSPEAERARAKIDHAWMDKLGIPKLFPYRWEILGQEQNTSSSSSISSPSDDSNEEDPNPCFIQQMMTLMRSHHVNRPPPPVEKKAAEHNDLQLSCRLMVEFQRLEWQRQIEQRKNEISQSMYFLQSIMEDWSNRAWVVSEYNLARKHSGRIKFWFNQLSYPVLHRYPFFCYEFDHPKHQRPQSIYQNFYSAETDPYLGYLDHQRPYRNKMELLKKQFRDSMRRRLSTRTVLEMMLQSKASRTEDRFYSILPLSPKYKHHIKDKHSISDLHISDMLSVRLQLLKWMDTKDQLNLLFCAQHPIATTTAAAATAAASVPLLPTFATHLKTIKPGLLKLIHQHRDLNFNLEDQDCVRLTRDDRSASTLDVLWVRPKKYYVPCHPQQTSCFERPRPFFYKDIAGGGDDDGMRSKIWKDVGLDPTKDTLDAVLIPLFLVSDSIYLYNDDVIFDDQDIVVDDDLNKRGKIKSNLQLVGSWAKNTWICYRFCSDYNNAKIDPSRTYDLDPLSEGFRIY
ncbi:hypothetical protein BCR42DRAFT_469313 [Absidia repens]|uniref:Heterokaryon incompatibility domain-containing protein n=1 Tax=Absidia repens TaxID=90262 RepID=A0A1X2I9X1_9FUNG|nr:hypothetical protein BCR42DRAFT_469313 [Absidia repens]